MHPTGVPTIDKTLEHTFAWVDEVCVEMGDPDRNHGWIALRGVLHHLRDAIGADEGRHLGAQLPILLRGEFYDGWNPRRRFAADRHADDFLEGVEEALDTNRVDAERATRAVLAVLGRRLDGEAAQVRDRLAEPVRSLWPDAPVALHRPSGGVHAREGTVRGAEPRPRRRARARRVDVRGR